MEKESKIYIAGHRGMVGSAIARKLQAEGFTNLLLKTSSELDLRNQQAVDDFFAKEKPDYIFLSAAKVGGIQANNIYLRYLQAHDRAGDDQRRWSVPVCR